MKPITYSKEFFKKKFVADTMKEAYMNACKWFATNILSKDELHNVQIEFEKGYDEQQFPTVTIHLFAVLNEEELRERHCKICREFRNLFYINQEIDCNRCDTKAYQARADEMLLVKINRYRELLSKRTKED